MKQKWNKKLWKEEFKKAYDTPEPLRKAEFLNSLEEQEVTSWDFIVSQFGYIRKWNWALAGAFFLGLILCTRIEGADTLGILSALVPLLALTSVSEGGRSMRYGMEELELSSRFTLKAVVMARLGILGIGNMILLGIICPILLWKEQSAVLNLGVYVLVPYLLTCFLNLFFIRKIQGKESLYYCCGSAALVSGMYLMFSAVQFQMNDPLKPVSWVVMIVLLAVLTGRECIKLYRQSEEYVWNL